MATVKSAHCENSFSIYLRHCPVALQYGLLEGKSNRYSVHLKLEIDSKGLHGVNFNRSSDETSLYKSTVKVGHIGNALGQCHSHLTKIYFFSGNQQCLNSNPVCRESGPTQKKISSYAPESYKFVSLKVLRHSGFHDAKIRSQQFHKSLGLYLSNFHSKNSSKLVIMSIMISQTRQRCSDYCNMNVTVKIYDHIELK